MVETLGDAYFQFTNFYNEAERRPVAQHVEKDGGEMLHEHVLRRFVREFVKDALQYAPLVSHVVLVLRASRP